MAVGLPEGGRIEWPPPELKPQLDLMTVYSAWYKGDPDELGNVYGGGRYGGAPYSERRFDMPRTHPSQYRGGLLGTIARAWWGKPVPPGDHPNKLHVPAAEDIAVVSSELLFAEPPRVRFQNAQTQKRWDEAAARTLLHAKLLQGAEVQSPLGGVYMVITWDKDLIGYPFIRPVQADVAVPEFRFGWLTAVTFWQCIHEDKGERWRHLERHEPGRILHGLYKGTEKELGYPIPLQSHPETERLLPQVNTIPGRLTAAYVPNALPNRLDPKSNLGRSDYTPGIITLMDALDETYTSVMRDLEQGKSRLVVPESYLQSNGPGYGTRFESERSIFTPISAIDSPERAATIAQVQFMIRAQEHLLIAQDLMAQIVRHAGYSAQSVLGDDSTVETTATEANIKDRRSNQTMDKKSLYWGDALETLIETYLLLDKIVFGSDATPERPKTEFGEQVQEQPLVLAQTAQALFAAESASIETRVRIAHPAWEDEQVKEEVNKIKEEMGTPMEVEKMNIPPVVPGAPKPGQGQGKPAGLPGTNPTGAPKRPAGAKGQAGGS
jgi:hypothetical protein